MSVIHMSVADVKRRFADVIGRVVYGGDRVVVERRGRPVVAIVPLSDLVTDERSRPGSVAEHGDRPQGQESDVSRPGEAAAESSAPPPTASHSPPPESILDALGCGGPEAEEFCRIVDQIIEERSLDLGRPAPDLR